ncbi:alpha-protein kinase 2 isoform X1 [Oryzias latipes]|nr:alpha-protein kinase 2 isoform X1 [Oryzias latipes]XP_023816463.1 alpha-protein kinase 2 isoform X1 [Oryzias latipes]
MDLCSSMTQRQSEPALTEIQDEDSRKDSGFLSEHAAETETEWSDQLALNVSSEERTLQTCLPSSSKASSCALPCSKLSPAGVESRTCCCSGSSEHTLPVSPHPSFIESYTKPSVSFSPLCRHWASEASGEVSFRFEDAMDFDKEPKNSHPAPLLRLASSQSDSLESNEALAPMLDLYSFESGPHNFILSQAVDPLRITCPEFCPLSQAEEVQLNCSCDACVSMCNSEGIQTQCHCGFSQEGATEGDVSGEDQEKELCPPDVNACGGDFISIKNVRSKEVDPGLSLQLQRCDSPDDLWLDACQYLTDEDAENQEIPGKTRYWEMSRGHSVLSAPFVPPQVSDFSLEGNKWIGWCSDDNRGWGPPIERWPSVDSWASALSDLAGFAEAPPGDFTAAFAEVGGEIDALTQALEKVDTFEELETPQEYQETRTEQEGSKQTMGVQDQLLKTQSIPGSSIQSGQSSFPLCFEAGEPKLHDKASQKPNLFYDQLSTTQRSEESEILQIELPAPQHPSVVVSLGKYSKGEAQGAGGITFLDAGGVVSGEDDLITLNITEETDLNVPGELQLEKPFGDVLCQVTEESGFPRLSSAVAPQVEGEGNKSSTNVSCPATHHLIDSNTPDVDAQHELRARVWFDAVSDLDGAVQVKPQLGTLKSLIPFASLDSSHSSGCQTNSYLEGEQIRRSLSDSLTADHVQQCTLCQTLDGITYEPLQEGDAGLIHKRQQKTIKAAENPPVWDLYESFLAAGKVTPEISYLRGDQNTISADRFVVSDKDRIAFVTLELNDPFVQRTAKPQFELKMPHKTHKNPSEVKARSKKEKSTGHHHGSQTATMQENISHHVLTQHQESRPAYTTENSQAGLETKEDKGVIEAAVRTEKGAGKSHSKKKKKHGQNATLKNRGESFPEQENGAKPKTAKGRIDMFEAKLAAKAEKAPKDVVKAEKKGQQVEAPELQGETPQHPTDQKHLPSKTISSPTNDEVIKRLRLAGEEFGRVPSELKSKLLEFDDLVKEKEEQAQVSQKKAYSEVVKQKTPQKEEPKVLQPIHAESVSEDPQSLCLWCQLDTGLSDSTVTWSRDGTTLSEIKRSVGDDSRVSLIITNASHKDLGKYECRVSSQGFITLTYLLTYEVLSEIVIPTSPKTTPSAPAVEVCSEEEDAHCSRLLFKEDFLSDQYFGEQHPISIVTEKVHFGEGMHRRAFRTKMQAGQIPLLVPGDSCVLKVHNSLSYGTNNNNELVQKNFDLAVEECQVQNTAREYIKAYTTAAKSVQAFGDVPEIIPIYLVHRPSNEIPYATLEEELIGDFVKYSIKDGKEINLMRRDSEAGQKCCAFQHWVYEKTDGNLLVTDMQGVGMKLTDVGIATCKKGYKGFKGNCSTSFIDQFKALHQCNKFCEILGLKSIQPKAKKPAAAPKNKPKPPAAPKKKTFGPTVKGKSQ